MIGDLGAPELLIILLVVVLLFGAGRVGRIGGDLGTAIKDFRKAVKDDDTTKQSPDSPVQSAVAQTQLPTVAAPAAPPPPNGNTAPPKGPQVF